MNERLPQPDVSAPPARWHSEVPFTAVELKDGLWATRQTAVRERTVPFLYAQYEKNGLFEALDVNSPPGPLRIPFNNRPNTAVMYWDSDIAKWIEMASYTLATRYDPALDARIDDLIARIAKAQQPDGYFNTYFIRREPAKRAPTHSDETSRPLRPSLRCAIGIAAFFLLQVWRRCLRQNTGKSSTGSPRHLRLIASSSPLFLIV